MWAYCPTNRIQEADGMMAAGTTCCCPSLDGYRSAFNLKGLPVNDDISDLPACRFDNPSERLPRHVHPMSSLLLIQPFEICQPQRLIFIYTKKDLIRTRRDGPLRPETGLIRHDANLSATFGSWHDSSLCIS